MNDTSIVIRFERPEIDGQRVRRHVSRVYALDHKDARVGAQPPVELVVPDVERDHARGAVLQQDVGEAAGGRADVERRDALDAHLKCFERMRELDAAAADPRMIGLAHVDVGGLVDERAGLRHAHAVDVDVARQQHGPRSFSRLRESAGDEQLIESDPGHQAVRPRLQVAISASRPPMRSRASAATARATASAARRRDSAMP